MRSLSFDSSVTFIELLQLTTRINEFVLFSYFFRLVINYTVAFSPVSANGGREAMVSSGAALIKVKALGGMKIFGHYL